MSAIGPYENMSMDTHSIHSAGSIDKNESIMSQSNEFPRPPLTAILV